jgi:hypothetical protein
LRMLADPTQLMRETRHLASQGKLIVIIFKEEGLANHLALFGHFIAFAEEYGYQLINPTFKPYAGFFYSTQHNPHCAYPFSRRWPSRSGKAKSIREMDGTGHAMNNGSNLTETVLISTPQNSIALERPDRLGFDQMLDAAVENPDAIANADGAITVLHEVPGKPYTPLEAPEIRARINDSQISFAVGWYFRAVDCVQRHAEKIRRYFQPVENCVQRAVGTVNRLRQESDTVVGVHVRHGDYREWLEGEHFHPASQYATWMHQVREQFSKRKVAFFVCSDEQRNRSEFPGLQVEFGCPKSPLGDLYGLAECDYIFGPVSTFSMWASFYGNKRLFLIRSRKDRIELNGFRHCSRLQ